MYITGDYLGKYATRHITLLLVITLPPILLPPLKAYILIPIYILISTSILFLYILYNGIPRLRHIRSNGYQIDPYIRNLRILDIS